MQRRGAAVVGHRVEGDVDVAVLGHHVAQAHRATERHALGCHAQRKQALAERRLSRRIGKARRLEHQAGLGQLGQDARPQPERVRRQLGHVVEGAEGQRAFGVGWPVAGYG